MVRTYLLPLAALVSMQTGFAQSSVEWSNATASGNGCPIGTSIVTVTPGGDEIAWTFDTFGFNLSRGPATASLFCRLSASARIKKGLYLGRLTQEMTYGATKSARGSSLSVGAQSRFFGKNLPELIQEYPDGIEFDSPLQSAASSFDLEPKLESEFFCDLPNPVGLFQSTLSAAGRVTGSGTAALNIQGQNVTFRAITTWLDCSKV